MSANPNILLITADQFRADSMSAAGHPLVKTPHLDRLAEEGVRFAQHYSQCPPCGPSRTSLLTGMYQMNHRSVQNGTPLDGAFTNLAELVRSAAYVPWLIGYTDTAMDPRRFHPKDPRAGRYEELLPGILPYAPGSELGSGDSDWRFRLNELGYENWNKPYRQDPKLVDPERPTFAPIEIKAEHSDTAYTADRAMRFFRQNDVEQPWFLHVSFLRPHPPFVASQPYHAMYDLEDVPDFHALRSLDDERAIHPYMPFRLERLEMNPKLPLDIDHPNNSRAWRQARATYYGLITELDYHIGRMVAALKQLGVYDNTLIVFTSDHAEMLGDHWCWGKETPFDAAVQTPLIVKSPFVTSARGRVVESFTEHVDVTPTILDHIGVDIPLQCDGRSLRPFLEGGLPSKWRDAAHWEFDFRSVKDETVDGRFGISIDECGLAVVRTTTQKYVHFAGLPPLYYDIAEDPAELSNLSGQPAHAAAERDMARRMLSWRMAFNRRELTGIRLQDGTQIHAARSRENRLSDRGRSIRIAGIREIADRYRTWFVDAYGVLHDGAAAFPGVLEALLLARRAGVTVVIVTNSGQRIDAVAARLAGAGIAPDCYDHVMSSGELSWRHIEQLDALSRLFLLYPSGGPLWLNHLRHPIVDDLAEAELMVVADMPHRTEEAARAGGLPAMLETAAALRLPLLVPDSDVTWPHNGVIRLGPGWIARRYADLGGETIEFGKPYAPIFAAACHLCHAKPEEVIMIGDNLATDIAGANRMGLSSLLVLKHGVHGGLSDSALAEAVRSHGAAPTYVAPAFAW